VEAAPRHRCATGRQELSEVLVTDRNCFTRRCESDLYASLGVVYTSANLRNVRLSAPVMFRILSSTKLLFFRQLLTILNNTGLRGSLSPLVKASPKVGEKVRGRALSHCG
jgi:hypothetical protein